MVYQILSAFKASPEIKNNALNFASWQGTANTEENTRRKMGLALGKKILSTLEVFKIKHHRNGEFLVFQTSLK